MEIFPLRVGVEQNNKTEQNITLQIVSDVLQWRLRAFYIGLCLELFLLPKWSKTC